MFLRPESAWGWVQILVKVIWENGVLRRTKLGRALLARRRRPAVREGARLDVVLSRPEEVELDGDTFGDATHVKVQVQPRALIVRTEPGRAAAAA